MPRANRSFVPGQVWHITQRCHRQAFLLRFKIDRDCWTRWLFEGQKRYKVSVLNYIVTSNHVHVLAYCRNSNGISRMMQLAAGQTGQRYNQRRRCRGAFWEDRYHATAVETDAHLHRCIVYIDLNMVRAGVVTHPAQWRHSGYHQIQQPGDRYQIVDQARLKELCGYDSAEDLRRDHQEWVGEALRGDRRREPAWTEAIAVGSKSYVEQIEAALAEQRTRKRGEAEKPDRKRCSKD